MKHVLVVADQTVVGAHITAKLYELKGDGELDVHVAVPAGRSTRTDPLAARRLRAAIRAIEAIGATASGFVGPNDPMAAVREAYLERDFDEVVVSTLPPDTSRWVAIDLPHRIRRRVDVPVHHVVAPEAPEPAPPTPIERIRVLVVEDREADLALCEKALELSSTDVEVTVARNGAEALTVLRTARAGSFDLVLLDLQMPVVDGFELLEQLADELDLGQLTIIVFTGSSREDDRERAHALGAGAFVVKDLDFERFAATVDSIVNEVADGWRA